MNSMRRLIDSGDAIDVTKIGKEIFPGMYRLGKYLEGGYGFDYCDPNTGIWIYSIGINKRTGNIFASADTDFYMNPDYECVWLR